MAAVCASLLLPVAAGAMPIPANPEEDDITACFDRVTAPGESARFHDAVDGNYWGRRTIFTLDSSEVGCSLEEDYAIIYGVSVLLKTPFQIDTEPDIDDIDTTPDAVALVAELASIWPDFDHWVVNAVSEGAGPPLVGESGAFTSVEICIDAGSVANCIADSPVFMTDLGGGFMVYTIAFGEGEEIELFDGEEPNLTFDITTLSHSNAFAAPAMGSQAAVPEQVMGFRMLTLVPEAGLTVLLLPALALLARARGRSRT